MVKFSRLLFITVLGFICTAPLYAQVLENVRFGKNRVQYKKFIWQYYQSRNFNTFFNQNGQELAKFVMQVAEEELPQIEAFTEYSLQRRANIVVYNEYGDMQQSNIGIAIDSPIRIKAKSHWRSRPWPRVGPRTPLVPTHVQTR